MLMPAHVTLRTRLRVTAIAVGLALLGSIAIVNATANAADVWQPKTPPLSTRWTPLVGPNNALPEYPRPQLSRTKWLNLNGLWGYTGRPAKAGATAPPPKDAYREQILVPFPHRVRVVRTPATRRSNVVPQGV